MKQNVVVSGRGGRGSLGCRLPQLRQCYAVLWQFTVVGGDAVTWCLHSVMAGSVIQKPITLEVHSVDRTEVASIAC